MSIFRNLRDLCDAFEEDLRNDSTQQLNARVGQSFDDEIANKMQDLSLFTAKLRFLQAKATSMGPECPRPTSEDETLARYEDAAMWKVIEQQTVSSFTQFQDVRRLISTPDSKLEPELAERKEAIISKLKEYRLKEEQLRETDAMLTKAEDEHSQLRAQWDEELGALRDIRDQGVDEETGLEGPLYNKLRTLIDKMELMRWLLSRLVTSRADYDWLSDPDKRLQALKMARQPNSVETYTGNTGIPGYRTLAT